MAGLAIQCVVTGPAGGAIVALAGKEAVAAVAARERVVPGLAEERVVTGAAIEAIISFSSKETVVAGVACDRVMAGLAEQAVVAGAACSQIVSGSAEQTVLAVTAAQDIVAIAAEQGVVASAAQQAVVILAAEQRVVACRAGHDALCQRSDSACCHAWPPSRCVPMRERGGGIERWPGLNRHERGGRPGSVPVQLPRFSPARLSGCKPFAHCGDAAPACRCRRQTCAKNETGGASAPPVRKHRLSDQNKRRIAWSAWFDRERAVCDSCWRVWRASRLAASALVSAFTSESAPSLRVSIRLCEKS